MPAVQCPCSRSPERLSVRVVFSVITAGFARLSSSMQTAGHWRLELFLKENSQVSSVAGFLSSKGISKVNLPNKKRNEPILKHVREIQESFDAQQQQAQGAEKIELDICPHFSLKNQWNRTEDATLECLREFAMEAGSLGCRSMLLISGGGHKKACSADMLGLLAKNGGLAPGSSAVHCAYNPYFPCEDDQRAERESLRKKMASGLCSGLWLQIGSDVSRLEQELMHIRDLEAELGIKLELHGSVFLPSKKLLAQQRFRPWRGVFLDQQYLHDVDYAWKITEEMVRAFSKHDVTTLVESAVTTEKDLATVTRLMSLSKDDKDATTTVAAPCLQPQGGSLIQEPGSSMGLEAFTAIDKAHQQQQLNKVQSNDDDTCVMPAKAAACPPREDKLRKQNKRRQKRSLPA